MEQLSVPVDVGVAWIEGQVEPTLSIREDANIHCISSAAAQFINRNMPYS